MAYTTINKPTDYFNTKLYAGTGSSNSVTGVGHQPDFTWIKSRDNGSNNNHMLFDAVRGATKYVKSDQSSVENTLAETLKSFDSDGFTVGTQGDVNTNNINFTSWNWKAGTTGSGTSTGSGTGKAYSYSVNTTSGFSIVKYIGNGTAGHTIPHHLGIAPTFTLVKALGNTESWQVISSGLAADKFIQLNSGDAEISQGSYNMFNSTRPNSTVVTLGNQNHTNQDGTNYIMYNFCTIKGFSKSGKYTSNNTANNGPFIYTGFKPAFVLTKISTSGGANWRIFDNRRDGFNGATQYLQPNTSDDESNTSPSQMDLLSNGFKLRGAEGDSNYNTETVIYMAFAEEPLVANIGNNGLPATAE
tara:strand:+ start:919 stop:1992 length:1074 start_codon:yes stop_codon:yes gene_type:complete